MSEQRPNLLVLMSDQHRADVIGCAGALAVQTPHLDRLAAEGTRYERAYCQGPLCMPARASLLTERYVRDHGVTDNNRELPPDVPTFLHALQGAGYHTACFGKMHLYIYPGVADVRDRSERMHSFGFDELHETGGKGASVNLRSEFTDELEARGLFQAYREHYVSMRGSPAWATVPFDLPLDVYSDRWIGQQVARWIADYNRDEPFLLWAGFPGPHNPWDAPTAYVDRYADVAVAPAVAGRPEASGAEPYARFLGPRLRDSDSDTLTDARIAAVRRAYFANVTLIDEQIGAIVAALQRRGLLENTWIVYTADHGEMLGDHGLLHKRVFYEPAVRVPLIIRPPGGAGGAVARGIVEHLDIPATLRAIAGAGAVPGSEGRSLLDGAGRATAFSENLGFTMAVTDRWKLVVHDESRTPAALFDLESDPTESRNLISSPVTAAVQAELLAGISAEYLNRPAVTLADARPGERGGHDD